MFSRPILAKIYMTNIPKLRKKEEYNENLQTWGKGKIITTYEYEKYTSYFPEKIRDKWSTKKI